MQHQIQHFSLYSVNTKTIAPGVTAQPVNQALWRHRQENPGFELSETKTVQYCVFIL